MVKWKTLLMMNLNQVHLMVNVILNLTMRLIMNVTMINLMNNLLKVKIVF